MRRAIGTLTALAALSALLATNTSAAAGPADPPADLPGIVWWALGDSYSSGEGLRYNDFEANPPDVNCERATGTSTNGTPSRAYSVVAKDQLTGVAGFRLLACTGAITNQWREQWQETGGRRADLITMSFGGNNVGFADVIKACAGLSTGGAINAIGGGAVLWALNPALGCKESKEELYERVDMLVGSGPDAHTAFDDSQTLPDMYAEIASEAVTPGGHVVVLGYPNIVEESGRWTWRLLSGNRCHRIRRADAALLRDVTGYLNQQIGLAVERANDNAQGVTFHFLDVSQVYEGDNGRHGLCTGQPWLNGLTVGTAGPDDGPVPIRAYRSFHPTQLGHDATGEALATQLRLLEWDELERQAPSVDRSAFAGTWTGMVTGLGQRFQADVELEIVDGALRGTIEHPDLPCRGNTVELDRTGDQVLLITTYTATSRCIDGGTHRFTAIGADELRYEWLDPDSDRIDTGTLRRVPQVPEVGSPGGTAGVQIATSPAGGRSAYSDQYWADVVAIDATSGFLVDVAFVALGRSDLRRPDTSCLVNDDGLVATPIAQTLTVDTAGEFRGTWTFPILGSGTWWLRYSCRNDYSAVPIATANVPAVGIAEFSTEYYAVVLSATRTGSTVDVRFASHGNERTLNELRDPTTSCLVAEGRSIPVESAGYVEQVTGEFYDGTLRFASVPEVPLFFRYSCQSDYPLVELPI